jgi:hypothetical protein
MKFSDLEKTGTKANYTQKATIFTKKRGYVEKKVQKNLKNI